MEAVAVQDLVRDFGEVRAVDGITLSVQTGCITAVLGPNGAGKTTAVEMMLGLRRPTSGTVHVLGHPPTDPTVRQRVGAMLQDPGFPEATTVGELLALVGLAYPDRLPLPRLLEFADLTGLEDRRIAQLSGGQRQRVAFGMAVAGKPELLFLDEPTAALDVAARRRLWDRLRSLAADGDTVVFTTHNLVEADQVADRVVVIDGGRVVADGTPATVKQLVAGRLVRLTTDLSRARLEAMPGVEHVDDGPDGDARVPDGRRVAIHASDTDQLLRALIAAGASMGDLTVEEAALEDAVIHLTAATHDHEPSATTTAPR